MRKKNFTEEAEFTTPQAEAAETEMLDEEYADYSEEGLLENEENDEAAEETSGTGRRILTILIIIIALVALFFASSKLTSLWLDYRQTPISYESDAPDVDEEIFDDYEIIPSNTPLTDIDATDGSQPIPSAEPSATKTPAPSATPAPTDAPTTKTPAPGTPATSTPATSTPAPAKTPAPTPVPTPVPTPAPTKAPVSIVPGNPAA